MAHHNSTPALVLKAPQRTVAMLVAHTGIPRALRRHAYTATTKSRSGWHGGGSPKDTFIPTWRQAPATNIPYRKPVP